MWLGNSCPKRRSPRPATFFYIGVNHRRVIMNKDEYYNSTTLYKNSEYKRVRELLNEWKQANGISENCIIHHRDDTEETRAYNEAFYERWGCNEDGTFEYGKYVVFMTIADHVRHHHTGKIVSEECRRKLAKIHLGMCLSDEAKQKLSKANSGKNNPMYGVHRFGGDNPFYGKKHTDETKQKLSDRFKGTHISDETRQKISNSIKGVNHPMYGKSHTAESIAKNRESNIKISRAVKYLYTVYKENGGKLLWKSFRHALKIGDITFKIQPVTVFTDGSVK